MKGYFMDFTSILKHLNDHHKSNLEDLCKKFDKAQEVQDVEAIEVDFNGITLRYNQDKIFTIAFNKKADESTIKDTIIQLCLSVKTSLDSQKVKTELEEFMREFRSICLASLHKDNSVVCCYAPLIQDNENYYIYIREVSEHFSSIS